MEEQLRGARTLILAEGAYPGKRPRTRAHPYTAPMLRAGAALSTLPDAKAAAIEAAEAALAGVGERADSAFLFATSDYGDEIPVLLDTAIACLGTDAIVGACAHGVLACGLERETGTAVAVIAQAGLPVHPFLLEDLRGDESDAGEQIAGQLGGPARPEDLVVLFPDPRVLHAAPLLEGVERALAPARIVGAGAGDPVSHPSLQWCGRRLGSGSLAGMVLRGSKRLRVGVTQACRPATEWLTVTRCQGHWLRELDGRPALEVYREAALGPLAADLGRAAEFLLVAIPAAPDSCLGPGGYRVRNVMGFEPDANAFAISEQVPVGSRIALVIRDSEAARDDLKAMLAGIGGAPAMGLYFNCCARGAEFFGVSGLESAYLEQAFGSAPVAGMFGSCEIGPIGESTELLTYTGVLALLD